jgi:hypothetical protein
VKVLENKNKKEIKSEGKMTDDATEEEKAFADTLVDATKKKAEKVAAEIGKRLELKAQLAKKLAGK